MCGKRKTRKLSDPWLVFIEAAVGGVRGKRREGEAVDEEERKEMCEEGRIRQLGVSK